MDDDIRSLITLCISLPHPDKAWASLWNEVKDAAYFPVRKLLAYKDLDLSLADDILQELFFHLQENDLRRLRAFRGATTGQFRAYIRTLALRFAKNQVQRCRALKSYELRAWIDSGCGRRDGPTEIQFETARSNLISYCIPLHGAVY